MCMIAIRYCLVMITSFLSYRVADDLRVIYIWLICTYVISVLRIQCLVTISSFRKQAPKCSPAQPLLSQILSWSFWFWDEWASVESLWQNRAPSRLKLQCGQCGDNCCLIMSDLEKVWKSHRVTRLICKPHSLQACSLCCMKSIGTGWRSTVFVVSQLEAALE